MKITKPLKLLALLAMVVSLAVGCSTATEEQPAAGPSKEQQAKDAIAAAKDALQKAEAEEYAWRDTGKIIKSAEEALDKGDYDKAIDLANQARQQSELAVSQKYEELQRLKENGTLSEGAPMPKSSGGMGESSYTVSQGDNLWNIAGKPSIYNNPFEWPLIYKNNSDKISDADLIYPGQVFDIDTNPSSAEVSAAVQHAKTRGSWSLGVVEESDKAYLAQ
jgi:nucleoid-associated protein YgaU